MLKKEVSEYLGVTDIFNNNMYLLLMLFYKHLYYINNGRCKNSLNLDFKNYTDNHKKPDLIFIWPIWHTIIFQENMVDLIKNNEY